ncbi:proteasome stabiliser-domain-containing protein [Gigaspora rosea]|uniref:Proteasome stabiliser-domain-containing protein n=1 Tax=Gigaspora rosea TaxID=44941 RepID=A0A397VJN6_9GLOM|nr:proteasome stabiliser-domain-containing protein [Gigaspora rosea]
MAEEEIELLERVELRLALAETDAQLEKLLNSFLSPILLKLASPHEVVRTKVMGVLTHINKRTRAKTDIKLPLNPLIDLICTDNVTQSAFVKNFAIIYLEMAYSRLTEEDQIAHMPNLINNIASKPQTQKQSLFHILLTVLQKFKPKPADSPSSLDPYNFAENLNDAKFLLASFLDVMLYNVPPQPKPQPSRDDSSSGQQEGSQTLAQLPPPGMSIKTVKFVTNDGKIQWSGKISDLKLIKLGILRFINSSAILPDSLPEEIHFAKFLILLVASCDSFNEVIDGGEDGIKKMKKPDMEKIEVVKRLYLLYQGTINQGAAGSTQQKTMQQPASPTLKLKIMGYICRSKLATNTFPSMLQVAFDCLYGPTTNSKLQNQGMLFVQWIARMADTALLKQIAQVLLSGLLKLINEDIEHVKGDKVTLIGFSYISISLLAQRVPDIFRKDFSILNMLFSALSADNNNIRVSVQEALSNMVEAYQNIYQWADANLINMIENILEENINKPLNQARFCAVKYAVSLFPFSHIHSRYICLLASNDEKLEIREMALRGLSFPDPRAPKLYPNEPDKEIKIPSFSEMVNLIYTKSTQRTQNLINTLQTSQSTGQIYIMGYRSEVYINILRFLRHLMIINADPSALIDDLSDELDGEIKLFDPNTRMLLKTWIKDQWSTDRELPETMDIDEPQGAIHIYLCLIEKGMTTEGIIDTSLQFMASSCLLELISLGPSSLSRSYENKIDWFKSFLSAIKLGVRNSIAHLLGIISTSELESDPARSLSIQELIKELITISKDQSKQIKVEYHDGSILALGYIIGRLTYRYPSTYQSIIPASLLSEIIEIISENLDSTKNSSVINASKALGEICRYTSRLFENYEKGKGKIDDSSSYNDKLTKIVEKLIGLAKTTKEVKTQETAITALGHIALGNSEYTEKVLSLFYDLSSSLNKQVEVNFTIGEAITCVTTGWESLALNQYLDIADASPPPTFIEHSVINGVLNKIFSDLLPSGKASVKKAVCVWMLCLVKFCSKHEVIKTALPKIHSAFSMLLADRDEFTQEVASKGIGLVYELGDQNMREQLVNSLVDMLSEGKRQKETINADTQLFDSNTLGQTPDGSAISTYQSILSLASDMNQPELVYKFMQLASHNAMWQSRKGAAFGFSVIIAQAEKELEPYLKDLIPRLYRFQYDPNPKVNEAMSSIWKALVKEPKKAVEEYFDVIVKDLLKALGDRLWRTRESSANALADILQGQSIQALEPYLHDLWTMCFRVLDDIKESVRVAAFKTCRALTKITVKYCDPDNVSINDGQKIMDIIMPFLLTKGLVSDSEDVRKFSLRTILRICKSARILLKLHITEIVGTLLEGLSSMEPQVMNYLSFHVEKYDVTQEQLENSRLSAAKMSPMMEGIESCIDYIDESVMENLTPRLLQLVRKGIGLPTKAGCARFLVTMCLKKASIVKTHGDSIMKALSGAILDVSPAVRKSYAVAVGYVAHLSPDNTLIRFIGHLKKIYCENSEQEIRSISGITALEISRHASDELKRIHVEILPFAYYGLHDSDTGIKNVWNEVWDENTAGSTNAIKLYLKELIELLSTLLESPSWQTKRQAALTIADVAKIIEKSLLPHMAQVIPLLMNGLSGRTWVGKEALVEALVTASISCKEYFADSNTLAQLDDISKILVRESKKTNKQYKRHCIDNLGRFADAYIDCLELYTDVKEFLIELATSEQDPNEMDEDDANQRPLFLLVKSSAMKCLGLVWPRKKEIQVLHSKELGIVLATSLESSKNIWNVRLGVLASLDKYIDKLDLTESDKLSVLDEETLLSIFKGLKNGLQDGKYVAIRTASLDSLKNIIEKVKDTHLSLPAARNQCLDLINIAENDPVPAISELAKNIHRTL